MRRLEKRIRWASACSLLLWLALAGRAHANPTLPSIPAGNFNVLTYGASGDGVSDDTAAIQDTINAAGDAGGGTVELPAGTYLCGPLTLTNNINLQIDSGAILQMLPLADFINYPPQNQTYGNLIYAKNVSDIEISGSGTIDGQGADWWPPEGSVFGSRPYMVFFNGGCHRVLIQGVTLQNPPKMHVVFKGSDSDITIDGITINTTDPNAHNADGIDLVGTHCLVQNCTINAGDDNIALGSSSSSAVSTDILITNCTFGVGHGVSIGSNTAGGVSNLTVTACSFNGTDYGIRMKSNDAGSGGSGQGGVAQNLVYSNITMTNIVYGAIVIYSYYNSTVGGIYGTPDSVTPFGASTQKVDVTTVPIWRNITISSVTASVASAGIAGIVWGRMEVPVTNLTLRNVSISASKPFSIYNAQGVQLIDSQITVPTTTNAMNFFNAEVTVTNSAANTNLVTLGGLATPPTNIVLTFFNATAAITDTNMLGSGTITLGGSTLTFNPDSVSFFNNLNLVDASTLAFTSGTNTYSGVLGGSGSLTLTLPAKSLLTLQNDSSGFSGGVTVSNGTVLVNNATGSGAVTVLSAATLGGTGVIGGPVIVNGTLAPGKAPGTLTISNNLVINGVAALQYALGTNSDLAVVSGDLTLGGILNVADAGGFTNTTYMLFTYGGALTYNGVSVGTAPAGYNYAIDTNTSGQVNLVVTPPLPPPPAAPSGLTATTVSSNQINLAWMDNASNEDGFEIERAPDSGGNPGTWTQIATVSSNVTAYTDIGLTPLTTYWYRVRAYNSGGDSDYSDPAGATTPPLPPQTPSGLTATAVSTNQVNLSWTDNSSNEDGFEIERAPDSGGSPGTWAQIATVGANVTTYSDTGLPINTKYWYRVRAYNAAGDSDYSNQASATTLPLPPQAPSSLTATTASSSQINLSWADNSGNEDGFKIERSPDGTNFTQIAQVLPNTTAYRNTGLALGTTYFYRVRAYNRGGSSDFSNVPNATTLTLCSSSAVFAWGYYWSTNVPPGLTNVVAISAGYQHSLALRSTGTVIDWVAIISSGETNVPPSVTNAVAVAAGGFHGLALRSTGTVVGWGLNSSGQTNVPRGLSNVVAIAGGENHSLALKSDGTVVGWGLNSSGQTNVPPGLIGVVAIAAGYYHSLALKSDGTVVGWGSYTPPPPGLSNVVAIAAGNSYSLALKGDGTVVGWGDNNSGKCTPPAGLANVVGIAAGYEHSLGLKSDGTVVGWGQSFNGETNVPPSVAGVVGIGAGYYYSLVLMCGPGTPSALVATTISASRIDLNWVGSLLGDGIKIERATSASGPWTQIAQVLPNTTTYRNTGLSPGNTYYYRVCAYTAGNNSDYSNVANASTPALCAISVAGWGNNSNGQATPPSGLTGVVAVAGGNNDSLALRSDGTVVGWGWNSYGETNVPASVTNAVAIAAGGFHNLALKSDGTVVGWGSNSAGQTNVPASVTNAVAIAAGFQHSLALRSDGTVFSWGDNSTGQTNVPPGLRGVVAIAAGYWHSLALRSDGTVVGWGYNFAGQTNVPVSVTNAMAIAAGYFNSLALRNNGTVVSWGGPPGPPSGLPNLVAIADAYRNTIALSSDGTVFRWATAPLPPPGLTNVVAIAAGYSHSLAMTCGPNAPSGLVATAVSTNQIDLSWTDNSADENRFGIERLNWSGGSWTEIGSVDPNVTVYSDTTVSCGQTFDYRVRAYNAAAGSPYSYIVTADTSTLDTDADGTPDCWMLQYFGHPTGQASDLSRAQDDADGDGLSNLQEYLAGTDPTNSASGFQIIGIAQQGDDILVTWTTGGVKAHALQATAGDADGGFTTNDFNDIFTVIDTVGPTTNYLDVGAAASFTSRYYRVRIVP